MANQPALIFMELKKQYLLQAAQEYHCHKFFFNPVYREMSYQ